jgi:hypothetical protein
MKTISKIGLSVLGLGVLAFAIFYKDNNPKYTYGNSGTIGNTGQAFDAKTIANLLEKAMWDSFKTDESTIFQLLAPLSEAQFYNVMQAFGKRSYNTITGGNGITVWEYDLKTWLKSELNSGMYNTLQTKFYKYL